MQIKEIMTTDVNVIHGEATLSDAARMMRDLNVGAIPVADGQKISGVLTDRDIVVRSTADGRDPNTVTVREVASTDVAWCYEDEEIEDALGKMKERKIRRLPVVSRENQLVGIVSIGDIAVESSEGMAGEALEEISTPNRPKC
jgi:CBS domain-containing protein